MKILLVVLVATGGILSESHHAAAESLFDRGLAILTEAVARGKNLLDQGVGVKSERMQSVDFFGSKLETNVGVKTGFGDAVAQPSSAEVDLARKKRSLNQRPASGLVTNTNSGTNVNVVKIKTVTNVNNYGSTPASSSAALFARKARLSDGIRAALDAGVPVEYGKVEEKVSVVVSDMEVSPEGVVKAENVQQTHEGFLKKLTINAGSNKQSSGNDGDKGGTLVFKSFEEKKMGSNIKSEMKPGGSLKSHGIAESISTNGKSVSLNGKDVKSDEENFIEDNFPEVMKPHKLSRRSPQEASTTVEPRGPGNGRGPPQGGPGSCGPPPDGQGGPGGRSGGGRGPPPTDGEGSRVESSTEMSRAKRAIGTNSSPGNSLTDSAHNSGNNSDSDSSDSDSDSESDSSSEEENSTNGGEKTDGSTMRTQVERQKRSPCGGGQTTTVAARRKRETFTDIDEANREKRSPCGRTTTVAARKKREADPADPLSEERVKRSPCGGGRTTTVAARKKRDTLLEMVSSFASQRIKRSPCGRGQTTTVAARRKREVSTGIEGEAEREKRSPCGGGRTTTVAVKKKREAGPADALTELREKRSPCGRGTTTVAARKKRDLSDVRPENIEGESSIQRNKRSPCGRGSVPTTVAVRRKRAALLPAEYRRSGRRYGLFETELQRRKRSPCGGRTPTTIAARRKREVAALDTNLASETRFKRSPCGGRTPTTLPARRKREAKSHTSSTSTNNNNNNNGNDQQDPQIETMSMGHNRNQTNESQSQMQRNKRSPCGGRSTTVAGARKRRDTTPEETSNEAKNWFNTMLDTVIDCTKRLIERTRNLFQGGDAGAGSMSGNGAAGANPDAERF